MNARAWNLFVLAGLLGTLLVLPAASHAAAPATLTAYMSASAVSPVPTVHPGQPDPRQVVFISYQLYVDSNNVVNTVGRGTPVTPSVCGDTTAARQVVTRKLGPPFPQALFRTEADIVGTVSAVQQAYGKNYRITSVVSSCSTGTVKVTLQLIQ